MASPEAPREGGAVVIMGALAVGLAALPVAYMAWLHRRHGEPACPAEVIRLVTPDGATLALYRYAPAEPVPGREPVFMISGFGLNRSAIDFDERYSWARGFAREGFDTWILELRGSGRSRRAHHFDGSFDDYLVDARTAIAHVLATTGAEKLHWVGYSLGAMLMYAALGTEGAARVRSGVAVESPVSLRGFPLSESSGAALDVLQRVRLLSAIPYRWPSRLALPILPRYYDTPLFGAWMNLDNLDRALLPPIVYRTLDDVPTALALQLRDWMGLDTLMSVDRATDYLARLGEADVPVLLLTGASDWADRAAPAAERLRAPTHVRCTREGGFSADYGHTDLIFGSHAPEEIFPLALDWVRRHDSAGSRAIR